MALRRPGIRNVINVDARAVKYPPTRLRDQLPTRRWPTRLVNLRATVSLVPVTSRWRLAAGTAGGHRRYPANPISHRAGQVASGACQCPAGSRYRGHAPRPFGSMVFKTGGWRAGSPAGGPGARRWLPSLPAGLIPGDGTRTTLGAWDLGDLTDQLDEIPPPGGQAQPGRPG